MEGVDGLEEGGGGDEVGEGGVGFFEGGVGCVFDPLGDPEAADAEVCEDEGAVGDGEGFAGHGSVGDVGAGWGEELEEAEGAVSADGVVGEFGGVFAEGLLGGVEAFWGVWEDEVCAEGGEGGGEGFVSEEAGGFYAHGGGELDDALADAGV